MHRAFLFGLRVYLRALEDADVREEYIAWLNDPEVTRYLETGKYPCDAEALRQYVKRFQGSTTHVAFAIIDRGSDAHIGNVTLNNINWVHRTVDTGLMIGNKAYWGKGYAFEAWSLVIEYGFQRLGLRKIIAGVIDGNTASLVTLQKLGFKIEGRLRQEVFIEGEPRDGLRLGLFRDGFYKFAPQSGSNPD